MNLKQWRAGSRPPQPRENIKMDQSVKEITEPICIRYADEMVDFLELFDQDLKDRDMAVVKAMAKVVKPPIPVKDCRPGSVAEAIECKEVAREIVKFLHDFLFDSLEDEETMFRIVVDLHAIYGKHVGLEQYHVK